MAPKRFQGAGPTQRTQPKKGKPVEIPVPTRAELIADLKKAAAARKQEYRENQAPPPSRPDPSQDAPPPDVGNRGW